MDFIIFGFVDNFVLIIGIYFSYTKLEVYLEKTFKVTKMSPLIISSISAGLGNTFGDAMGFLVTGNFNFMGLTITGCLLAMTLIPLIEKFKK